MCALNSPLIYENGGRQVVAPGGEAGDALWNWPVYRATVRPVNSGSIPSTLKEAVYSMFNDDIGNINQYKSI